MKLPEAKANDGDYPLCPAGNHLAVCFEVIDLGTQESQFNGKKKRQRKIWIGWEIPNELTESGEPFVTGRRYTLSSYQKADLRKHLESWRGRAFTDSELGPEGSFDIKNVIGVGCFLNIVHSKPDDRTFANVEAVAPMPKGTSKPGLVHDPVYLSLEPDDYEPSVFDGLSEYMQGIIRQSPEWQTLNHVDSSAGHTVATDEETAADPDIPF